MLKWIKPKNWSIVKVYRDFENFRDWKKTIKREEKNKNSKFNLWKLQRTRLFDVYTIINLEDEDIHLPINVQRTKILEGLNPVHRYLDEELGFAECLHCEFNQFEDDKGNPTLSYLIAYRFIFNKFSLKWLLKFIIFTSAIIYVIIHFKLISILISWLSNLI